jgi:predicted  nucleic acid-binding Zn-ribbon protein
MESFPLSLERLDERMRTAHARIRSNHDKLGRVEDRQGKQAEAMVEIRGQLTDVSEDLKEIKDQVKWLLRGVFGAIAVGLMFVVAIGSLIVQGVG